MSLNAGTYQVTSLMEKMNSPDKDFRYMAINDLMTGLNSNSITLDDNSERSITRMLLKLLDDKNGEVQNLTVKCLSPLVSKLKEASLYNVVESLLANMESEANDKEQLRDISSMGLKIMIPELEKYQAPNVGVSLVKKIIERLIQLCAKTKNHNLMLESLDIISDSLALFGTNISNVHKALLWNCLLPNLRHDRMAVRKKAINAICNLVVSCSPELFLELFSTLQNSLIQDQNTPNFVCTVVQCMSGITRKAGHRLKKNVLIKVMPILMQLIANSGIEEGNDTKESCLQTFEAFVRRCPKEVEAFYDSITQTALTLLCHDPNYSYDNEEDEAMRNDSDAESEDSDGFNEFSDDDDVSWKVRRASAKLLEAIVASKPLIAADFLSKGHAGLLVSRFKEREESVKEDIFHAFIVLLRQTKTIIAAASASNDTMEAPTGPAAALQALVPNVVREVRKLMKVQSMKTRQGVFLVLNDLVLTLPGCLADQFPFIVPGIEACFEEKSSVANLKLDCLTFVNSSLKYHPKEVFYPHLPKLVNPILKGANDKFYRISADSLTVLQQLVKILKPEDDLDVHVAHHELFLQVFEVVYLKLKATDLDQEVKENAIACMSQILYNGGDFLDSNLQACLKLFVERLNNEITRVYAVKAFTKIAQSPRKIEFQYEANLAMPLLIGFLKKNQRSLRLYSVECLKALINRHGSSIHPDHLTLLIESIPIVLHDSDLQITQIAFDLLTCSIRFNPNLSDKIMAHVFSPSVLTLLKSPVLQGAPLESLLNFLDALFSAGKVSFQTLYNPLHSFIFSDPEGRGMHKQCYWSIAQAVALLAVRSGQHVQVVQEYTNFSERSAGDHAATSVVFCYHAIGEIGKRISLSSYGKLPELLIASFDSSHESVKNAASVALGHITVNSIDKFLPCILNNLKSQQKRNLYLLLQSLKEFIVVLIQSNVEALTPLEGSIWQHLMQYSDCSEEGTRNIVAECLGKLTLLNYTAHLNDLKTYAGHTNPLIASTMVTAVKFSISDKPHPIDHALQPLMGNFLSCLGNLDVNLRRLTLVMLNSAAHNRPMLIRNQLTGILPLLYKQTLPDKTLIKIVEMGPFKHEYDLGLDLRKTAFECMYTLLETCLDKIPDIFEYLMYLQYGLKDHYDIKMLAHLMLIKLTVLVPGAIFEELDKIMENIKVTINVKVKTDSVKQEFDKQEEMKKSALRALHALLKIPEADKNPAVVDVLTICQTGYPDLFAYFQNLKKEDRGGNSFNGSNFVNGRNANYEHMDTS